VRVPDTWREVLSEAIESDSFRALERFVAEERRRGNVYPHEDDVFAALTRTPPDRVRVAILGQDPYHGAGQAHGLAFSVRPGVARPPSLQNIHKELESDLGHPIPSHGCLDAWADRGVLLLNAVLTVREGEPGSHAGKGWESFTDAVLDALVKREKPVVFVLWGSHAQKKGKLVERPPHRVLRGVHPSPLSAHRGFLGSKPFSTINAFLLEQGQEPVDWRL
jgi:uracil-DNA glycosylase